MMESNVVEDTMKYFVSQIKVAFEITGRTTQRTEIFEYPLPALRELVLNSVVHRNYMSPIDIQIKIFDNSIVLYNPGELLGGLTIEALKSNNYHAFSRNKLLAEAFYLTGDIEKYGSGFMRIRNEIMRYPTMQLVCQEIPNGFQAEISYKIQKTSTDQNAPSSVNATVNAPVNATLLSKLQKQILESIRSDSRISYDFLAKPAKAGIRHCSPQLIYAKSVDVADTVSKSLSRNRATVYRNVFKLKEAGYIRRIGSDKDGYWKIKEE